MSSDVSGNPQHWKVNAAGSVLIVIFIAAILINSLLIFGVQVWLVYNDDPETALAEYPGYTIVSQAERNDMIVYLLASPEETRQLVTLEKHVFADQYRVVKSGTTEITEDPQAFTIWGDAVRGHITVEEQAITSCTISPLRISLPLGKGSSRIDIPLVFFLYSVLLIAVELGTGYMFHKIRGNE